MQLSPDERITKRDLTRGLASLIKDGVYAQAVGALTAGVLLVGYGLALGASNFIIGLLAAVPFLAQLTQIPAILLVERLRARRTIAVVCISASRLLIVPLAFLPWLPSRELAQILLVVGTALSAALGAISGCGWNSWVHDLVPGENLGNFFSRRLFYATVFSMMVGLAAGFFVQWWDSAFPDAAAYAYTVLFLLGAASGAMSTWHLSRVPEPRMAPPERVIHLGHMLAEPFHDRKFRRLIGFLAAWQFATNLAAPFFTVYMVSQLGFNMGFVTFMMVVSQLANVLLLRKWGELSDRFSNKAVLRVSGPAFLLCIFAWTMLSLPTNHFVVGVLVTLLHIAMGFTVAGINLASGNIGLKMAPRGRSTAYLAASSIVNSVAAGIAPIIGGLFADDFAARELSLIVRWTSGPEALEFITLRLRHWDFFFMLACLFGLYSLHRLSLVEEEGHVDDRAVMQEILTEARRTVTTLSSVSGLRQLTSFPFGKIVEAARAKRMRPREPQVASP